MESIDQNTSEEIFENNDRKRSGYVYILSNPSMPNVLKIGMTTGDVKTRALQLHSTGLPTPFEVEVTLHVQDCHKFEKAMHERFSEERVQGNREFFSVDLEEAKSALFEEADGDFTNNELFDHLYEAELADMEASFVRNKLKLQENFRSQIVNSRVIFFCLGGLGLAASLAVFAA